MESPVVLEKPPEYHGSERGFPFDEDESTGAWSELASRHPDIAARLRQRPATWARKRRPSSQDATEDFGDSFGGFDRFPFDDIPPEFRDHFPTHWNRRFGPRDEQPQQSAPPQQSPATQQQTTATQTEHEPEPSQPQEEATHLPQYGLRNTVDLGQKSPADPSLVDADERNQRSMSAPPESSAQQIPHQPTMSGQNHHEHAAHEQHSNVRHIPIFVEGRDEPVINKNVDHATHYAEAKPTYAPPPQQQPHIDREQYFADDGPASFHHPPNFSRAFGTPFNKGFRQGPQPFVQQKVFPQTAYTRGASPQRSQSPKPPPAHEEHFVKVPVQHEHAAPKPEPPTRTQAPQRPPQQQQVPPQARQASPAPREQTPPPPKPSPNDPITLILSIQTDVLNLMTEVENFKGAKNDKQYLFLDEMLTRNLIKLDNIETDGKENIRQARKEAIKCIQKCIAVLEAKAESNAAGGQTQDVEMKDKVESQPEPASENGEVEMKEPTKEGNDEPAEAAPAEAKTEPANETETKVQDAPVAEDAQAADTRPEDKVEQTEKKEDSVDKPKKGTKVVKKRNKSKDNKEVAKDSSKQEDSNKKVDSMQVDDKGDKAESQVMEVDGPASQ